MLRQAIEPVAGGRLIGGFVVFGIRVPAVEPRGTASERPQAAQDVPHSIPCVRGLVRLHGKRRRRNAGGATQEYLVFGRGGPCRERSRHFPLRRMAVFCGQRIGAGGPARGRDAENVIAEKIEHGSSSRVTCGLLRLSGGIGRRAGKPYKKEQPPPSPARQLVDNTRSSPARPDTVGGRSCRGKFLNRVTPSADEPHRTVYRRDRRQRRVTHGQRRMPTSTADTAGEWPSPDPDPIPVVRAEESAASWTPPMPTRS